MKTYFFKGRYITLFLVAISLLIAGCSNINPENFTTTPSDNLIYYNPYLNHFPESLKRELSPIAIVLQTKSENKYALISRGTRNKIYTNSIIEFYNIKHIENSDLSKKFYIIPFASGRVIKSYSNSSWVEIFNNKNTQVRINNFARISKN